MDELAHHSDSPEAFHRKIVHNEFGGNPRVSGGIDKRYRKNIKTTFLAWGSENLADIHARHRENHRLVDIANQAYGNFRCFLLSSRALYLFLINIRKIAKDIDYKDYF